MIDWLQWPIVPKKQRPKALYHNDPTMTPEMETALTKAGWDVQDVKLMPNKTEKQRAKAILAFLEGVRMGSIDPEKGHLKYVELEAKICGLLKGGQIKDEQKMSKEDLDSVLAFGKKNEEG